MPVCVDCGEHFDELVDDDYCFDCFWDHQPLDDGEAIDAEDDDEEEGD